jgi:hypothetical protein
MALAPATVMQVKTFAVFSIVGLCIAASSAALGQKTEPAPSPAPAFISPAVRGVDGTWTCGSRAIVNVVIAGGSAGTTGTVRVSDGGVPGDVSQDFKIAAGATNVISVTTRAFDCHRARRFTVEVTMAKGARVVRTLNLYKIQFQEVRGG